MIFAERGTGVTEWTHLDMVHGATQINHRAVPPISSEAPLINLTTQRFVRPLKASKANSSALGSLMCHKITTHKTMMTMNTKPWGEILSLKLASMSGGSSGGDFGFSSFFLHITSPIGCFSL